MINLFLLWRYNYTPKPNFSKRNKKIWPTNHGNRYYTGFTIYKANFPYVVANLWLAKIVISNNSVRNPRKRPRTCLPAGRDSSLCSEWQVGLFDTSYFKNMFQCFWLKDGWNFWDTRIQPKESQKFDRNRFWSIIKLDYLAFTLIHATITPDRKNSMDLCPRA